MKKTLEKRINRFLSLFIIVVLLPLLVTILFQQMQLSALLAGNQKIQEKQEGICGGDAEVEQTVLGIVAKEIRVDSPGEAILAQSVIARTNLYAAREMQTAEPKALTLEDMKTLWGEEFDEVYGKLEEEVAQTSGQVLTWKGDYIYAAYHAVSAGETRNMKELYEDSDMPYLQKVSCPKDTAADGYIAVSYWDEKDFFPEESAKEQRRAEVTARDEAGYVLSVQVGDTVYTGEEFRDQYGLDSSCFSISVKEGRVRVVTKGIGHGFGLSQYTAAQMAEEGKDYKEILMFFYPGAKLTQATDQE